MKQLSGLSMRCSAVVAALSLLLAATGAVSFADSEFISQKFNFKFSPPLRWSAKSHPDAVVIYMEPVTQTGPGKAERGKETTRQFLERMNRSLKDSSSRSGFRANITVTAAAVKGATLADLAKEGRAKASASKRIVILTEVDSKLGSEPAVDRLSKLTMPDQTVVQSREVFCIRDGQAVTLTLAALPASFPKLSALFDRSLATFAWIK